MASIIVSLMAEQFRQLSLGLEDCMSSERTYQITMFQLIENQQRRALALEARREALDAKKRLRAEKLIPKNV